VGRALLLEEAVSRCEHSCSQLQARLGGAEREASALAQKHASALEALQSDKRALEVRAQELQRSQEEAAEKGLRAQEEVRGLRAQQEDTLRKMAALQQDTELRLGNLTYAYFLP